MAVAASRRLLLLVALGLPCVFLVGLGIILIKNGGELAQSRLAEDRRRMVSQMASGLMAALERVKLEEAGALAASRLGGAELAAGPRHSEVALIGWIREGQMWLPWEVDPGVERFREMLRGTPYAAAIAQGERQEVLRQLPSAVTSYEHARALATDAAERDYADLLRGRVIVKRACECTADARNVFASLLDSRTLDDQAVPLALYAATQLLQARVDHARVLNLLDRQIGQSAWLSPVSSALQEDLLASLAKDAPEPAQRTHAQQLMARLAPIRATTEQAAALQREFPRLLPAAGATDVPTVPIWRSFGGSWLVSESPPIAGLPAFVIAVHAAPFLDDLNRTNPASVMAIGTVRLFTDGATGQLLGPEFPELRVGFGADNRGDAVVSGWRLQRLFYVLALLSVVGVTVLGGYVFWRDVRRELQIAELRTQFVASVSHELRTPLTAIRMFAETLQMARPLAASDRAEYLNTIVSESERLTRLINNVLDFAKIERGQRVYRLSPSSIAAVVRSAAGAMQYPLAQLGFELRVDVADDLPMVRVDEDAIQQAVLNLLSNAMKYSREKREIDVRVAGTGNQAVIEVTDYGLGIPPHEQARIFDRFYRIPVPENARIPGAGLGLAIVAHIVNAHGGSVTVRSQPGAGSTFAIRLPLDPAA